MTEMQCIIEESIKNGSNIIPGSRNPYDLEFMHEFTDEQREEYKAVGHEIFMGKIRQMNSKSNPYCQ